MIFDKHDKSRRYLTLMTVNHNVNGCRHTYVNSSVQVPKIAGYFSQCLIAIYKP